MNKDYAPMSAEHKVNNVCPYCSYKSDRASGVGDKEAPTPNSISICIKCGEISVFDDNLRLRKSEDHERLSLMLSELWPKCEKAIKYIKQRRKK